MIHFRAPTGPVRADCPAPSKPQAKENSRRKLTLINRSLSSELPFVVNRPNTSSHGGRDHENTVKAYLSAIRNRPTAFRAQQRTVLELVFSSLIIGLFICIDISRSRAAVLSCLRVILSTNLYSSILVEAVTDAATATSAVKAAAAAGTHQFRKRK